MRNVMEFSMPVEIVLGNGVSSRVGEFASRYGTMALVVSMKDSRALAPIVKKVLNNLEGAGLEWVLFDEFRPNPGTKLIDQGAKKARDEGCDLVIAVGGGTAMDAATAIAVGAVDEYPIWHYVEIGDNVPAGPKSALPVINVSTTTGTGTEVNSSAAITNNDTLEKAAISSPNIYPKVSLIDIQLMLSLPPRKTALSAIDMLFHAIESYISRVANPLSEIMAEEALRLIANNIVVAHNNPRDVQARFNLAYANVFAGIAHDSTSGVLLHAMSFPLSGRLGIGHGEALSILALPFLRATWWSNVHKFARITRLLGGDVYRTMSDEEAAAHCTEVLEELLNAVGIKPKFQGLGVGEEQIEILAEDAFKTMRHGIENNPFSVTHSFVKGLYREALK